MCAICGIFDLKNGETPERETLDRMLETLRHRGPDGQDALFLDGIALGFDRLSFLDLTGGISQARAQRSSRDCVIFVRKYS